MLNSLENLLKSKEDLLKEIEQVKAQNKIEAIKKDIKKAESLIGSCSCSRKITNSHKALEYSTSAVKVVSYEITIQSKSARLEDINITNYNSATLVLLTEVVEVDIAEAKRNIRICNDRNNIDWFKHHKNRISEETFNELRDSFENAFNNVINVDNSISVVYDTRGREPAIRSLNNLGYKLIEIPTNEMYYAVYYWHPFVYNNSIIASKESIKLIQEEMLKNGPNVQVLNDLINLIEGAINNE